MAAITGVSRALPVPAPSLLSRTTSRSALQVELDTPSVAFIGDGVSVFGDLLVELDVVDVLFGGGTGIEIDEPEIQFTGLVGRVGPLAIELDEPTVEFAGLLGFVGQIDIELDEPEIHFIATNLFVELDEPTIAFIGLVGTVGALSASLDLPSIDFSGLVGRVGTLDVELDGPDVAFFDAQRLLVELDEPDVLFAGLVGTAGALVVAIDEPEIEFAGLAANAGALLVTLDAPDIAFGQTGLFIDLDAPEAAFTGLNGSAGALIIEFPTPVLSLVGVVGSVGSMVIELPMAEPEFSGGTGNLTGTLLVELPVVEYEFSGAVPGISASSATISLAMNTETQGLTTYTNFGFNSFARLNGVTLGANQSGIYILDGERDQTTNINAKARFNKTEFGSTNLKRVLRVYAGHKSTGQLVVRVLTDSNEWYEYPLENTADESDHNARAIIARGLKGRYWQTEIANEDGCDFEIDVVEVVPHELSRKIG